VDFASAGPGTPGGKLLRQYWQPVYLGSALKPGTVVPILIMGERFTLYRGESGRPHVVGFRCPHRNTQLSPGRVHGDALQCFYHGWTFDGDGRCIARPAENPPGPCAHVSIPAYPTHEHMGLIYAYLGAGEAPPFPAFPLFEDDSRIIENTVVEFPCNWFQTYENQVDEVHVAFVHSGSRSHVDLGREEALPETVVTETAYGFDRVTSSKGGPERLCVYPFPNHMRMIRVKGARDAYLTLVPTDDEHHILFMTTRTNVPKDDDAVVAAYRAEQAELEATLATLPTITEVGERVLAGKMTMEEAMKHPLRTFIEDVVAQAGQGAIHDRSKEVLASSDVGVARMRKVFERELLAIEEGRPGKVWTYSGVPAPTPGH
jgi:5,5'-dehydrodivanillate O-demethylase oxygenase subunit